MTPLSLLSAARVPRKAATLTKEGLFAAGISGVVLAGPDEGGAWRTTLAEGPGGGSSKGGGVGVIVIEGALEQRAQYGMCEAYVDGYDAIEARYDAAIEAYKAGEISRIATVINSPGGMRSGCFATARRVRGKIEAAGVPTVAVADEDCCSAAWIWALVSDKLYAPPDARVASIGAVAIARSISKKLEKEGVEIRVYRSGSRKMRPSGVEPFNEEDDAQLQAEADKGGELIAEWTAERRGGSKSDYLALQGAVFSGEEAARRGLIDGILTAHEVIEMALKDAEQADISQEAGLSALASFAEIKAKVSELRAAASELVVVKAQLAKVESERIAAQAKAEAEQKALEVATKRAAFLSEVKTACSDGYITPHVESSLLAHYDAHGETSARSTFGMVKTTKPIVRSERAGAAPETSNAIESSPMARMTAEDHEHCERRGFDKAIYAERKYGEVK